MLNLKQINNQNTYSEAGGSYYQYKLLSIDDTIYNNGYNVYFKSVLFSVTTITGRILENCNVSFWQDSNGEFITTNLKFLK